MWGWHPTIKCFKRLRFKSLNFQSPRLNQSTLLNIHASVRFFIQKTFQPPDCKKTPQTPDILKAYLYGILVALETQQNHPQECSYLRIVLIVYTL